MARRGERRAEDTAGDAREGLSSAYAYIGSDSDRIYALSPEPAAAQRVLWSLDTDRDVKSALTIGADGTLYVGSDDNQLWAIGP